MKDCSAQEAVDRALSATRHIGVVALDRRGRIGWGHTAPEMAWGYISRREERVF